jgi:outer membrane protein assembly factor BamB
VGSNTLYTFNATNGSALWTFKANTNPAISHPIINNNIVYFTTVDTTYALNAKTGSLIWSTITGNDSLGYYDSSPVIGPNGNIYILSNEKKIYDLNPDDGTVNYVYNLGKNSSLLSIDENGIIYYGAYSSFPTESYLYALDTNTWSVLWQTPLNNNYYVYPPSLDSNSNIFFNDGENIYKFDKDGNIIWTIVQNQGSSISINNKTLYYTADNSMYALR